MQEETKKGDQVSFCFSRDGDNVITEKEETFVIDGAWDVKSGNGAIAWLDDMIMERMSCKWNCVLLLMLFLE